MRKARTLFIQFDETLTSWQLPAFRAAIIEKVGREHLLFHHHASEAGYLYQYPLIQYKVIGRKPSLFCLGEGVEQIHHFFGQRNWSVHILGEKYDLKIDRLDLNQMSLNVWDKQFSYSLRNWLALNAENYQRFQSLEGIAEKILFLERLLIGNILSFAKGLGWRVEKPIQLRIKEMKPPRKTRYKGVPLLAFDVEFSCNIFLPNYLGLGKSASHGFGVVKSLNKNQHLKDG